ncbi:MAG: DUF4339 domain-containing protein [Pirellulaceae bacterium]|nr:DUF4339 domain-containing protein [Pirellulaceae bacterium]
MAVQWYCRIGDQQLGPITADLLRQLAEQGQLTPDSLVRQGEAGSWVPASRVRGLYPNGQASGSVVLSPAESGQTAARTSSGASGPPVQSGPVTSSVRRAKPLPGGHPKPASASDTLPAHDTQPVDDSTRTIPAKKPVVAPRRSGTSTKPPVASSPKPPPPPGVTGGSIPMGLAVPPPMPTTGNPAAMGHAAMGHGPGGMGEAVPAPLPERTHRLLARRKASNPWLLVGIAGGVLLVAGGVGLALLLNWGRTSEAVTVAANDEGEGGAAEPERDLEESDLEAEGPAERVSEAATAAGDAQSATGAASAVADTERRELVAVARAIRRWSDASRMRVRSGAAEVRVAAAWLEQSGQPAGGGQPGPAVQPAAGDQPASGSPPATGERPKAFVQMVVTNSSADTVVDYSSWNGTGILGAEARAALLDASDAVCPLVGLDASADGRQRTSVPLAPGESASDLLVFELPGELTDDLRLLLPRAAVGSTGHVGFTVPRVMLMTGNRPVRSSDPAGGLATGDERPQRAASPDVGPGPAGVAPVAGGPAATSEPAAGASATDDSKSDQPLTFDDLKRSIEGDPKDNKK